jgi:hypothetical protein
MSTSTDPGIQPSHVCQTIETDIGTEATQAANTEATLTPMEAVEDSSNAENYELDDFTQGFTRVPTEIIDVASGLYVSESTRLLPDFPRSSISKHAFPRYASRELFSRFIPECDPYDKRARTCRVMMPRRKIMLSVHASFAFLVFLANVAVTVWATKSHPTSGVMGSLSTGACRKIKHTNIGIHLLLNVFSSVFLGAGNYCMQVLAAPSSEEVRTAHAAGRYYEIGVHSVHNVWHSTRRKKMAWLLLGFCSTMLHLM